jgi:hypothetical protein
MSRASIFSDPQAWSAIYPELLEAGFPQGLIPEQWEYIKRWLINAVIASRINVESYQELHEVNTNACYGRQIQQAASNTDNDGNHTVAQVVRTDSLHDSLVSVSSLQRPEVTQSNEIPQSKSSVLPTKTSKNRAHLLASKLKYLTLSSTEVFYSAVQYGDVSSVKKILSSGKQISLNRWQWQSLLVGVVKNSYIEVLRSIVSLGNFHLVMTFSRIVYLMH